MEESTDTAGEYFSLLFNEDNFFAYWDKVGDILYNFAQGLVLILPVLVLLAVVAVQIYKKGNTNHNVDTLPLRAFKWVAERTYQPLKRQYLSFVPLRINTIGYGNVGCLYGFAILTLQQ